MARALGLLERIIGDGGRRPAHELASELGLALATSHRMVTTLVAAGHLRASRRGHYVAGPRLLGLRAAIDDARVFAELARSSLESLARKTGRVVHLGVLQQDMVTYLVRAGSSDERLFTRQDTQLEAYCSGIGKVLLAELSEDALDDYFGRGPLVRFTDRTIIDPERLRSHLNEVRRLGYAIDDEEIQTGLRCVALPLRAASGDSAFAISIACAAAAELPPRSDRLLTLLRRTVFTVGMKLAPGAKQDLLPRFGDRSLAIAAAEAAADEITGSRGSGVIGDDARLQGA